MKYNLYDKLQNGKP